MSARVGSENPGADSKRRRRPRGRRPKKSGDGAAAVPETGGDKSERLPREPREPRERLPTVDVPLELLEKQLSGVISDTITRKRARKFGFIYVGEGPHSRAETPRVYFSFDDFESDVYLPRKGYLVEFLCTKDDKDRVCAKNVKLTETGLVEAAAREQAIVSGGGSSGGGAGKRREAAPKSEKGEAEVEADKERTSRRRRERKPQDDRTVLLRVSCEGKVGEVKEVKARLSQSIGKLKHSATQEFDLPHTYKVYVKSGELLSKALLKGMSDNDEIHLKESDDVEKDS